MKCIFCCVFNQLKYLDMFHMLLESMLIYGNLDDNTHILVYTSTSFMNIIKKNRLFAIASEKIFFRINDIYDSIETSCRARLDLFHLPSITNYNKILYLDIDLLVKDDINKVFDVCKEDILYVLEEGTIDSDTNYWGKSLFENNGELIKYTDKSAFTSGILLFNNCEKIKMLFSEIKKCINNNTIFFELNDQPYIVYNAFKYNLYNNKILKSFAVNNDHNIHSDKVIHHFPGGPGVYIHKKIQMRDFLNDLNKSTLSLGEKIYSVKVPPTTDVPSPNDMVYNTNEGIICSSEIQKEPEPIPNIGKCIFCCVFNQPQYVDMFHMLLESILIYGNLDDNTHILVYTSKSFMNIIKNNKLFAIASEKIFFEINDIYMIV